MHDNGDAWEQAVVGHVDHHAWEHRMSTTTRARLAVLGALGAGTAAALVAAPAAQAQPWADAGSATVQPGVMTYTDGAQCTANFVFTDGAGDVFLGQAAHCAGTGGATETDGCDASSLPLGTPVEIDGATEPGTLVYSSWLTMQTAGETDSETCAYNDFALVQVDPADVGRVNPSVPFYGGPTGVDRDGVPTGDEVYSYGNSSLRLGLSPLSPKAGSSLGDTPEGWSHTVYTATPGIPGDSGSAFLSQDGTANGVLSTVAIAPLAGSNGVSDLGLMLDYASTHGTDVALANGTEPFTPLLP